ncbi:hypothetical protein SAMN05443575_2013 [Jatrophihabitans endophyticus]|uniref:DUF5666 domain-containing protein n=1 Tax=Jatrophihabitans endophyticus TaxID=1206085 RepID=A0A1M5IVG1_9ACTN|nr:hypothetical protein [Jatrophihabitans endophyticus]SHG32155.1 hypothetical protein SAMN05443575_2013 [Jatrophihabitans endophyticus]
MNLTYRKTLAAGGTFVALLGVGGTALATTGSGTLTGAGAQQAAAPTATPSGSTAKPAGKHAKKHGALRGVEHAQIVTRHKGATVTRTIYHGTVTAVSSSSLTVKAADGKSQAYALNGDTKYRERSKGHKPTASSLSKIAKGDNVAVVGTGTSKVTAKHVVELPKK